MNANTASTITSFNPIYRLPHNLFDLDPAPSPNGDDADEERIETVVMNFRSSLIRHSEFQCALKAMERCHRRGRYRFDEPDCLLITAESGCGKSTLRKEYAKRFPRSEGDERTFIPVLDLELPSQPTIKNVAERMLIKLGDPMAEKGSGEGKTERIKTLMQACGVELVILDEFQHFVDRSSEKVEYKVADWLKSLINDSKVPFVLMGLPRCRRILEVNEQLRRRFLPKAVLRRFCINRQREIQQFAGVLKGMERILPLNAPTALTDKAVIRRIYYATHGVIDHAMKLVSEGLNIALSEHHSTIDQEILRKAFERVIWEEVSDKDNPFHPSFTERHLNGAGEPFNGYH